MPAKSAPKTAPKAALKTAVKSTAKSVAKPAAKPIAKPTAKTTKNPVKVSAKSPAKATTSGKLSSAAKPTKTASSSTKTALTPPKASAVKPSAKSVVKPVANTKTTAPASPPPVPAEKAIKTDKPVKASTVKTKAPKIDKHYVSPPTAVVAQTTAKFVHASTAATATTLTPAIIPAAIKKNPKLATKWKEKPAHELTDAEVISMSDDLYMNSVQMAFFKHKLIVLRQSILDSADQTTEHLREETVIVPDPTDRATIEEEHALELRTRDRERKLLKKIEQSLHRIDQDDYGYCDETGEPIGVARLIARPTATLSLEAQQRRELKQKMFGD